MPEPYEQTGVPVIKAHRHTLGRKAQQILHRYKQPLSEMQLRRDGNEHSHLSEVFEVWREDAVQ
jgi:hypothetical protein